jgi:hypothetical protein
MSDPLSFNGRAPDFDSGNRGSNPCDGTDHGPPKSSRRDLILAARLALREFTVFAAELEALPEMAARHRRAQLEMEPRARLGLIMRTLGEVDGKRWVK